MSRTASHSKRHGPLAYGKGQRQRAPGYEWNNKRTGGHGWCEPGAFNKREAHRYARRQPCPNEEE